MVTVVSTHSQLAGEEQPHWVVRRDEVEMTREELGRGGWGVVHVAKFRGLMQGSRQVSPSSDHLPLQHSAVHS